MKHHRLQAKATLPSEKILYVGSTCMLYFLGPLPSESALLLQCSGLEVEVIISCDSPLYLIRGPVSP